MKGAYRILLSFAILAALPRCGAAAWTAEDPEIAIRDVPNPWDSACIYPIHIDVRSQRGARVDVTVSSQSHGSFTMQQSITVPSNTALTAEIPVSIDVGGAVNVRCQSGGVVVEKTLYRADSRLPIKAESYPFPVACVNGYLQRELEQYEKPSEKEHLRCESLPIDSLPRHWQSYAALVGILLFDTREVGRIRPEQREALAMWVKWLGGKVFLVGPDGEIAAAGLGLAHSSGTIEDDGPVKSYALLRGRVYLHETPEVGAIVASLPVGVPDFNSSYRERYNTLLSSVDIGDALVSGLDGVSTATIIICLVVLGVIMGPVNFWYIRKRKTALLFFITTPIIAFIGTIAIMGASMVEEGFGGLYNEYALLLRDENSLDGVLLDARGVRPGFFAPSPSYPSSALIAPMRLGWDMKTYSMTLGGDAISLSGDWFMPRFPTALTAVMPVTSRMGIDVFREGGQVYAMNNLGYAVKTMAAKLPNGGFGRADDIPPGGRAPLKTGRSDSHLTSLLELATLPMSLRLEGGDVSLVAECAGLPNIEDWGVGAALRHGTYYYCVLGDGEDTP